MKKLYLGITLLFSFFIFCFKPNAYVYSYDLSEEMVDLMPDYWFGSDGWLSRIIHARDSTTTIANKRSIWLSKDTIYVIQGYDLSSYIDIDIIYNDSDFSSSLVLDVVGKFKTGSIYSIKSEDDLIELISNFDSTINLPTLNEISFTCSSDKSLIGNNVYGPLCDNFLIPFSRGTSRFSIFNHTTFTNFKFYGLSTNISEDTSYSPDVDSIFIFKNFGFDKPLESNFYRIYTLDSLYSSSDYSDSYVHYDISSYDDLSLHSFVFYGRKYSDGIYYWDDLTYSPEYDSSIDSYCLGDYLEPVFSNGVHSLTFSIDKCYNVDDYDYIYMKVYLKKSILTNNISYYGNNYKDIFISDVCQDCIIDNIYQSNDSVIIFSTNVDNYTRGFYYQHYVDESTEGIYNSVGLVDFNTLKFDSSTYSEYDLDYTSFYGKFSKSVGLSSLNNKGFYSTIVNADKSFGFLNKYLYVPCDYDGNPIIYISNNKIDDDRLGSTIIYADKNGIIKTNHLNSSFISGNSSDVGLLNKLFSSSLKGATNILNCSISILNLVSDFFNILPFEVRSFLIILFCISMIYIFLKFIM